MTERPYILVDVDGVLNAISRCSISRSCDCHAGWVRVRARGFPLLLNPAHGPALLALAEETGAELAWGTTWEETANEHIGPVVGLPKLPWARMPTPSYGRYAHKADGFVPWVAGRPFVWFDDEPDAPEAAAALATQPHLVITVDETTGLTDDHIKTAREWLLGLGAKCGRCKTAPVARPGATRRDGQPEFTALYCESCIDRCHEATDFAHICVICASPEEARAYGWEVTP